MSPTSPQPFHDASRSWRVFHFAVCGSTNDEARSCGPWEVVVADQQAAGRGRHGRSWQSQLGGLWMSAVLPAPLSDPKWKLMPLAAGLAVAETFRHWGVPAVRLRWPNDIMVGPKKAAGILVERFGSDRCVVGMGINISNDPVGGDPKLRGHVVRLADLLQPCPSLPDILDTVLDFLNQTWERMNKLGGEGLLERLAQYWVVPSPVEVLMRGMWGHWQFGGVDARGRVRLIQNNGVGQFFDAEEIELLRESEGA